MKIVITIFFLVTTTTFLKAIDTVKVYNVHCSYADENSMSCWGGRWSSFYPTEKCPNDSLKKYIDNHKIASEYMSKKKFFWMKLYNTKDELIYEGLKYSDCSVGKFICYWPNGKIKLTGEYGGYKYSKSFGYRITTCSGKEIGEWIYYDENGIQTKIVKY